MSGGTRAITNYEYIVRQDSQFAWETPAIDMELANRSLCWQFKWDPSVKGTFTCMATLFKDPYVWETLVMGSNVSFTTGDSKKTQHTIVSLPDSWYLVGFIKWVFTPKRGSKDFTDVVMRVTPS